MYKIVSSKSIIDKQVFQRAYYRTSLALMPVEVTQLLEMARERSNEDFTSVNIRINGHEIKSYLFTPDFRRILGNNAPFIHSQYEAAEKQLLKFCLKCKLPLLIDSPIFSSFLKLMGVEDTDTPSKEVEVKENEKASKPFDISKYSSMIERFKKLAESRFSYLISFADATETFIRQPEKLHLVINMTMVTFFIDDKHEHETNPKTAEQNCQRLLEIIDKELTLDQLRDKFLDSSSGYDMEHAGLAIVMKELKDHLVNEFVQIFTTEKKEEFKKYGLLYFQVNSSSKVGDLSDEKNRLAEARLALKKTPFLTETLLLEYEKQLSKECKKARRSNTAQSPDAICSKLTEELLDTNYLYDLSIQPFLGSLRGILQASVNEIEEKKRLAALLKPGDSGSEKSTSQPPEPVKYVHYQSLRRTLIGWEPPVILADLLRGFPDFGKQFRYLHELEAMSDLCKDSIIVVNDSVSFDKELHEENPDGIPGSINIELPLAVSSESLDPETIKTLLPENLSISLDKIIKLVSENKNAKPNWPFNGLFINASEKGISLLSSVHEHFYMNWKFLSAAIDQYLILINKLQQHREEMDVDRAIECLTGRLRWVLIANPYFSLTSGRYSKDFKFNQREFDKAAEKFISK